MNIVWSVATLLSSLRLAWLLGLYVTGRSGVQRFHIESAAFLLVVIGFGYRVWRSDRHQEPASPSKMVPKAAWVLFVLGALALYSPIIHIGFLSDDFLLASRARTWQIGAVTLELFRPLPLLTWALLLNAGGGPAVIHLLNIVLHGTNAFLVTRVAAGWGLTFRCSMLAGLVMLTIPLAPEAVAWSAGVFDVMATTWLLIGILIARLYGQETPMRIRLAFAMAGFLALMSKETAAIMPALVLLDTWVRQHYPRRLLLDLAVMFLAVVVFAAVRLVLRFGIDAPPLQFRLFRRAIFRSIGGLAFPWHIDVIGAHPYIVLLSGLIVIALVSAFFLRTSRPSESRTALACVAWILIGIVPLFRSIFIAPDLQAARYLYISAVGWACLLPTFVASFEGGRLSIRTLGEALLMMWIAISAFGVRQHLAPWTEAGDLRDLVERRAADNPEMRQCATLRLVDLPDNVRGAYVFRVGAGEDFQERLGQAVIAGAAPGPCTFLWSTKTLSFSK